MRIELDLADVEHNLPANEVDVLNVDWPAVPRIGDEINVKDGPAWTVTQVLWEIGDFAPRVVVGPPQLKP